MPHWIIARRWCAMMIKRLDATFGKLEGESLELHDGLNVISAPNESGKSTWCAFVRAML